MKRLYRSKKDKIIGGVCGGIGEYFDIDPVLVRILWLLFTFLGGAGILAYIIAWVAVPSSEAKGKAEKKEENKVQEDDRGGFWGGMTLIVIGFIFLLFTLRIFWVKLLPLCLIVVGVMLILRYRDKVR
ncbi:hypothetical protein CH333_09760 [candidate division WOR-3 bacterium JGI_Cruoil_03_44_89]|uniref:Phage shock protein PspC N-terminal domain-containing protein n=1 Tax=candidate division WOR-3 bacterium JGI_Cruoil_03_44_89 TaxID=1973748 RepID=A0A235BMY1_UNCW3|nr:MAG: hypothetical protein CH333_09760 [candidate division WOR-3 bacterium JGI_Cruoil_03_44_89]